MEKTEILNSEDCGFDYFVTVGKMIIGCGLRGGVKKLDIIRVVVVGNQTKKKSSFLSNIGLAKADYLFDVDVDIHLADGSLIEVHSSEPKFLQKLVPYVWELQRKNPRVEFYGKTQISGRHKMIEVKGNNIYATNTVNDALVKATNQLLECFDEIHVHFDVIGRTCHQLLAHQLFERIDQDTYYAEITYNYGCTFKKKGWLKGEKRD